MHNMVKRMVKIPLALKKRAAESGEDLEARRAEQPRSPASSFESVTTIHDSNWKQDPPPSNQGLGITKTIPLETGTLSGIRKRTLDAEDDPEHLGPGYRTAKLPRSKNSSFQAVHSSHSTKTVVPFGLGVEDLRVDTNFPFTRDAVPISSISFQSEIDDSHRDEIDQKMIPWGSKSFLEANAKDISEGLKKYAELRLPFTLESLFSDDQRLQGILDRRSIRNGSVPLVKPTNVDLAPRTTPWGPGEQPEEATDRHKTKGIRNVDAVKITPKSSNVNTSATFQDQRTPRPLSPQSLDAATTALPSKPLFPKDFISTTGFGPINLFDPKTGKIIATRHPNGGIGYDPAVNWTPETSFADGGSNAPSETLVPIHPNSTLLLPRNRVPQHPKYPYANRESLWGLPGKPQNQHTHEHDDNSDNGSTTVVDAETEHACAEQKVHSDTESIPHSFSLSTILDTSTSFEDILVFRREHDTSFTSPSTKPCSAGANMLDIAQTAYTAHALLSAHPDSPGIYSAAMNRLERAVEAKILAAAKQAKAEKRDLVMPSVAELAVEIRDEVVAGSKGKGRGDEDGERESGKLEMKWAQWLVEATKSGVMHLKVEGCMCSPEPLREEEEDGW